MNLFVHSFLLALLAQRMNFPYSAPGLCDNLSVFQVHSSDEDDTDTILVLVFRAD